MHLKAIQILLTFLIFKSYNAKGPIFILLYSILMIDIQTSLIPELFYHFNIMIYGLRFHESECILVINSLSRAPKLELYIAAQKIFFTFIESHSTFSCSMPQY